jgi:hypothetical protein
MNFWVQIDQVKAVLFDLDDTLFDHKFSRLKGLAALQEEYPQLQSYSIDELEREHETLLSADYDRVLDGKISIGEATTQRIRKLCTVHDVNLDWAEAKKSRSPIQHGVHEKPPTCSRQQRPLDYPKKARYTWYGHKWSGCAANRETFEPAKSLTLLISLLFPKQLDARNRMKKFLKSL